MSTKRVFSTSLVCQHQRTQQICSQNCCPLPSRVDILAPCGLCQLPVGEGEEQQELQDISILLESVVKLHIKQRQQQAAQLSAQLNNNNDNTATTDRHHQLTQLQQQQQQRSSNLDTIYINMIDTVDHLAATADTAAEASDITAEERQRKQAADIRAAIQRRQQQQQQQQRSPSEAQHQDPSPRPRRQHHQGEWRRG